MKVCFFVDNLDKNLAQFFKGTKFPKYYFQLDNFLGGKVYIEHWSVLDNCCWSQVSVVKYFHFHLILLLI